MEDMLSVRDQPVQYRSRAAKEFVRGHVLFFFFKEIRNEGKKL
jgi:hypothetical protein